MPQFTYVYIDKNGMKTNATMEAVNIHEVEVNLDVRSIAVLEIHEQVSGDSARFQKTSRPGKVVNRRELIEFCIYMGTLAEAGLSLIGALGEYASEATNVTMKHISETLKTEVENGKSLSDGLARFPKTFTREFVYLVKACEINPWEYLDDMLRRIMSHPVNRLRELLPDQWKPLSKDERGLLLTARAQTPIPAVHSPF